MARLSKAWRAELRIEARFAPSLTRSCATFISSFQEGGIGWPFSVNVMVERDITRTKHLGPWMAEYAAMFILSGVVRYHPARWVGMIQRKANSKTLALVEAFVSVAETEFPTRVWEMLKRVTVIKGYVTALDELLVKSLG